MRNAARSCHLLQPAVGPHAAVAQRAGRPEFTELLEGQYGGAGKLKVQQIRNSNLLKLKVRGRTAELAKLAAETVVKELTSRHAELAAPTLGYMRSRLDSLKSQINADSKVAEVIARRMEALVHKGSNVPEYSLLLSSQAMAENTLASRNLLAMNIEMALSELNTKPSAAIEPVAVSSGPVFPRPLQLFLLGGLVGLLTGSIWVLRRYVLRESPISL